MVAVIPYTLDPDNGAELRYAIRSLYMHYKVLSHVILVGDKPDWYIGDHIPSDDIPGRKEYSIYCKLMKVQGRVLYTNDDFFLIKDFEEFPYYHMGYCRDHHPHTRKYRELYEVVPDHWLNFDGHWPMEIDTRDFPWPHDMPIKSTYANQKVITGEYMEDMKLRGMLTFEDALNIVAGRPFFSTHGNASYPGMRQLMQHLYPLPSPCERKGY